MNSSDRKFKDSCTAVFRKLLPVKKFKKMHITNIYWLVTHQGERGKQRPAKSACKGVGVVEEAVSALQLPKPPAPNSQAPMVLTIRPGILFATHLTWDTQ